MPGGRPTDYQPETAGIARHACMLGTTNETLAERFEVSRRTVDTWIATLPAFSADWRSACGNCGNSTGPRGALHTADWWSACANCGNPHRTVTCSSPQPGGEQDANLDLDHVEPEGVFWAVVEFQAEQDAMHHINWPKPL
jgi:hypothetical protein